MNSAGGGGAERAGGERRDAPASAPRPQGSPIPSWSSVPSADSTRRGTSCGSFREADAAERPGEIGALLRRERLYTSHLTYWRKQRDAGALKELGRPRGRKPVDPRDGRIEALERRAARGGGAREGA
jgi:hypothetical protein